MEGLWRTEPISLRPRDDIAAPPLPRAVLRHLVTAGGLGVGSRILVGGNDAAAMVALFNRLGLEAVVAGPASARYDAAIRLDLEPAPGNVRSLLSPSSLERTAGLLGAVRPHGMFLYVARFGEHEAACFERHVATFPGRTQLTVFRGKSLWSFLRPGTRAGFAVAAWQAPAAPVEPTVWSRRAAGVPLTSCCRWADEPSRPRRVA